MIRSILAGAALIAFATSGTAATKGASTPAPSKAVSTKSVQCKDAKGKFIKCPAPVAKAVAKSPVAVAEKKNSGANSTSSSKRCRDSKGRFAKCGTPGAK